MTFAYAFTRDQIMETDITNLKKKVEDARPIHTRIKAVCSKVFHTFAIFFLFKAFRTTFCLLHRLRRSPVSKDVEKLARLAARMKW